MAVENYEDTHYETRVVSILPDNCGYRLRQPIAVLVNKTAKQCYEAVLFHQNEIYPSTRGLEGRTPGEAIQKMCFALVRDLKLLRKEPKLGPVPKKQLKYLDSILAEKLQF